MDPVTHVLVGYALVGRGGILPSLVPDVPVAALIGWQIVSRRCTLASAFAERWPTQPTRIESAFMRARQVLHSPWTGLVVMLLFRSPFGVAYAAHIVLDLITHGPGAWQPTARDRLMVWIACVVAICARRGL
jgi:hypothetical protein